jgi:hypothetical protein
VRICRWVLFPGFLLYEFADVVVVVAVSGSLGGKEVDMCMTHLVQEEMVCTERIQQVTLQVGGWVCMWVIWPLSDVIGTQERFRPSP